MADIVISGDSSGSVTLRAPAVSGTTTLTLPTTSGTVLTTASTTGINASAITSGVLDQAYGGTGTTIGYNGFKNRLINGAMVIDQRNAGGSVTVSANGTTSYAVDRFFATKNTSGVFTIQQSSVVPSGFTNSLVATVTTADTSIASGDYAYIGQVIEGYNFADFGYGAAGAATFTASFWVRSNLTGTYSFAVTNNAGNRSYVANYTISATNTWEYKTVTIVGDTTGTWLKDNGAGIQIRFGLVAGSDFQQAAGSWGTVNTIATSSNVNWLGTVANNFYITGVQLEKGSTATSFDYRSYGTELDLCQRYYVGNYEYWFTSGFDSAYPTVNNGGLAWSYQMRATPSIVVSAGGMSGHHGIAPAATTIARNGVALSFSGAALRTNAVTSAYGAFTLNAEI